MNQQSFKVCVTYLTFHINQIIYVAILPQSKSVEIVYISMELKDREFLTSDMVTNIYFYCINEIKDTRSCKCRL